MKPPGKPRKFRDSRLSSLKSPSSSFFSGKYRSELSGESGRKSVSDRLNNSSISSLEKTHSLGKGRSNSFGDNVKSTLMAKTGSVRGERKDAGGAYSRHLEKTEGVREEFRGKDYKDLDSFAEQFKRKFKKPRW